MSSTEMCEELVNCPICLDQFTTPKTLQCLHTFCESCLRHHLAAYLSHRAELIHPPAIPCPTCREFTPLGPNGISGLRTDYKISKISEFLSKTNKNDKYCDICKTVSKETLARHFCRECNKNFCEECIYRHNKTEVFEAHIVQKLGITKGLKSICKDHEDEMEVLRYFCQGCKVPICTLCAMTDHMMHSLVDLDVGKARHECSKKIVHLCGKVDTKISQLDKFLVKLESFESQLKLSHDVTAANIKNRADELITQIRSQEQELLGSLHSQYDGKIEDISTEREYMLKYKDKLVNLREMADNVLKSEGNIQLDGLGSEVVRKLRNISEIPFLNPEDFNTVEANFALTFPTETPKLGYLGEANISTNFQFFSRIPIQLIAKITEAKLDWPSDATITHDGKIVVADTENYQLKVFDKNGKFKHVIAVGEMKPAGVVATKVRTLAVTDILDRCVKIYSEHGSLLYEFGHDLFDSPAGITVNSLGNYIVSDIGKQCITVHDSQGKILSTLRGRGNATFDGPWYVTTNDQNDIIVSDTGNHCVQIYDSHLKHVTTITDPDNQICPNGVSVDDQSNIFICDNGRNTISMYSPNGQFIDHILTEDDGINCPHGITIGESGQLVITQCISKSAITKHEARIYQLYE